MEHQQERTDRDINPGRPLQRPRTQGIPSISQAAPPRAANIRCFSSRTSSPLGHHHAEQTQHPSVQIARLQSHSHPSLYTFRIASDQRRDAVSACYFCCCGLGFGSQQIQRRATTLSTTAIAVSIPGAAARSAQFLGLQRRRPAERRR